MPIDLSKTAQRGRLLAALREHGEISTSDCRDYLSIMSPAARVHELRQMGVCITTVTKYVPDAAGVVHRQAIYRFYDGYA